MVVARRLHEALCWQDAKATLDAALLSYRWGLLARSVVYA